MAPPNKVNTSNVSETTNDIYPMRALPVTGGGLPGGRTPGAAVDTLAGVGAVRRARDGPVGAVPRASTHCA